MELNFQFNLGNTSNSQNPPLLTNQIYDVIVIGGGPAGLNASLYAKRKGLLVGIIATNLGGQVMNTSIVDNYLGLNHMSGEALIEQFTNHVNDLNIPILEAVTVSQIKSANHLHEVHLSDKEIYRAKTLIIATGSKPRRLNIPGETEYLGKGIAYCAICDAPLFKGKDVVIAGGGNSAVEAALDLSKIAKSITLVHRSQFRADKILVEKILSDSNIKVHLQTQILEVIGDNTMTGIRVKDENGERVISSDGLFIEIGTIPNSTFLPNNLIKNERGEIITDEHNQTNIDGIFACGDITQIPYKQIIIAASEGAKAALSVNEYLNQK
ncbi:FAD-dependent oxidoreductase [Mycoplasmatota bacterium]|nr:FAD-dependent oxidoreductase [Mycoplasmatota bacterium]